MEKDNKNPDLVISYHIDYEINESEENRGYSYDIKSFTSCIIDYQSNTVKEKYHWEGNSEESNLKRLFDDFSSFYKEHEDRLIFQKKPFVLNKEVNTIFIKTLIRLGFIKDESDFVFGHDCLDISDIYLMYYFCKSSKVESKDLETMLGDFGIMPQEKDTPFFKAVNSSRLGIQMMKKIGLIFLMSDMGGAKL